MIEYDRVDRIRARYEIGSLRDKLRNPPEESLTTEPNLLDDREATFVYRVLTYKGHAEALTLFFRYAFPDIQELLQVCDQLRRENAALRVKLGEE